MKVELLRKRKIDMSWHPNPDIECSVIRCLPFFYSPMMSRVHRVRSAILRVRDKGSTVLSVELWCGQSNFLGNTRTVDKWRKRNKLMEFPPTGEAVCATCEGRAVGAGQLGSHKLNGQMVIFTPTKEI